MASLCNGGLLAPNGASPSVLNASPSAADGSLTGAYHLQLIIKVTMWMKVGQSERSELSYLIN